MESFARGTMQFLGLLSSGQENFRQNARSYLPMDPAIGKRLQAVFAPHNERLFVMLGVDYGWNSKG
jgi:hypothetical protein